MFTSHYRAGTGALLVSTSEESRLLRNLMNELAPEDGDMRAEVAHIAAPGGKLLNARGDREIAGKVGLPAAYSWLQEGPGRVCVVWDWHTVANNPGQWRALIQALPDIRNPHGADDDYASMCVFVAPTWELSPANPLRDILPQIHLTPPDREQLAAIAGGLCELGDDGENVIDALCGLGADAAEQVCAETLQANDGSWNVAHLETGRRDVLRRAGLELWQPVSDLGGLEGFRDVAEHEIFPWIRDPQLAIRRILCAGVPGVGKSYCSRWLAHRLACPVARLSIPALKGGLVGESESNLRRALATLDAIGRHAPLICVLDEIDGIAREGNDGGTSAGMFSELLTWLQEGDSQTIVIGTLNRLDNLDAALGSRFPIQFFFDLPNASERRAIAAVHLARLGCENVDSAASSIATDSEGFSSREIAENIVPTLARRTNRKPDTDAIRAICKGFKPASETQGEQLQGMRAKAQLLKPANSPTDDKGRGKGRRVAR